MKRKPGVWVVEVEMVDDDWTPMRNTNSMVRKLAVDQMRTQKSLYRNLRFRVARYVKEK